jgi:hypothetical protein
MIKKALAAIALAGAITVMAPQASFADDAPIRRPVPGTVSVADRDAAAKQAFADIEHRLAADPLLARQLQRSASIGDTATTSKLLSSDATEVVAVGSSDSQQLDAVRVQVKVTVCVRVWGTIYCGSVTVTVDL